jgi:hypothetical protein
VPALRRLKKSRRRLVLLCLWLSCLWLLHLSLPQLSLLHHRRALTATPMLAPLASVPPPHCHCQGLPAPHVLVLRACMVAAWRKSLARMRWCQLLLPYLRIGQDRMNRSRWKCRTRLKRFTSGRAVAVLNRLSCICMAAAATRKKIAASGQRLRRHLAGWCVHKGQKTAVAVHALGPIVQTPQKQLSTRQLPHFAPNFMVKYRRQAMCLSDFRKVLLSPSKWA